MVPSVAIKIELVKDIKVKLHLAAGARLPVRATNGAAAYDVAALLPLDTYLEILPGERMLVPTGLFFEIPTGYLISLRPRSGLALKSGVTLLNSPATIDSDYRGELKVILINLGANNFRINSGDRIAQLLLERSEKVEWDLMDNHDELSESERGAGGFGSSGIESNNSSGNLHRGFA